MYHISNSIGGPSKYKIKVQKMPSALNK